MANQDWVNLVNWASPWQISQGTVLNTATTATITPQAAGSQDFILPTQPNGIQFYPGLTYLVKGKGTINTGSAAANLTVFLACGVSGTLASTLSTTSAIALGTGSLSGLEWTLEAEIRCIAIGSSGNTLTTEGFMDIQTSTAALAIGTANVTKAPLPFTNLAFNTYTAATALGIRATLSAATGPPAIQCNSFQIYQTD
jgi:hypothetical protein